MKSRSLALLLLLSAALPASPALAGPPYATDDPEPTEVHRWEVYGYAEGAHAHGSSEVESGLDINYGAAPDLQLTLVLPAEYEHEARGRFGAGAVELGAKLRVLRQSEHSLIPDVSLFPTALAPTARMGSGRWGALLPVWAQKDIGRWSMFGGAGYQINPGPGERSFWVSGFAVQRQVSERLAVGGELYHHTRDADDGQPFTGANLAATWRASAHWSLLASAGPGLQNAREAGRLSGYLALKADY